VENRLEDLGSKAQNAVRDLGSKAESAVRDLGSKAESAANRAAASVGDQFSSTVDYVRENGVQDMMDDVTSYVKAHPAQALIGAVVLGFVAGRMARRS